MAEHYLNNCHSVGEMFRRACAAHGERVSHWLPSSEGYSSVTYRELLAKACQFAHALQERGIRSGDHFNLFSENCFEWALADWAGQLIGAVVVPIYPTLPSDQASYIAQDCGSKLVVCGSSELSARILGVPTLLLSELASAAARNEQVFVPDGSTVSPESLATIIYTSGTTGNPKGVMLTHHCVVNMMRVIADNFPFTSDDVFFSFLPLSHVFERMNGHFLPCSMGSSVAYCRSLATISSDLAASRPTVMLTVPRFLDSFRMRVLDSVQKDKPIRQKLFGMALGNGVARVRGGFAPLGGLTDALVGKKIRARLGGRFRFFVSGGAALPMHTAEFFAAFGLPVLQGYGLTETCSGMCINRPDDNEYGTIGTPFTECEMRLAEDGEILIRGVCLMKGYYNLPEETALAIDSEGWFHSGDIGEQQPNGKYKITDRKKDLLVLANGKNVAPQVIENKLRESEFIQEAVLFGDGMDYVCGLIIPDFDRLKKWAGEQGIVLSSDEQALTLEPVRKLMKSEIDRVNKGLADFEKVKRNVLLNHSFTIESGELTPSLKVKRKVVKERFAEQIHSMM